MFGTGQAGNALAAHLAGLGMAVRAVSRHRPAELAGGTDRRAADVTGPQAAADAAKGASAVYQCVKCRARRGRSASHRCSGRPDRCRAHRCAAGGAGELVRLRTDRGKPMTEDLPLAAAAVKGRTRAGAGLLRPGRRLGSVASLAAR